MELPACEELTENDKEKFYVVSKYKVNAEGIEVYVKQIQLYRKEL